MDNKKFYETLEDYGIITNIALRGGWIAQVLEEYPQLASMTLKDAKEWFQNRYIEKLEELKKKL
jgi:uncharacterized protein (DUF433 family)